MLDFSVVLTALSPYLIALHCKAFKLLLQQAGVPPQQQRPSRPPPAVTASRWVLLSFHKVQRHHCRVLASCRLHPTMSRFHWQDRISDCLRRITALRWRHQRTTVRSVVLAIEITVWFSSRFIICFIFLLDGIALVLQQNRLRWYGHVLRKEDDDWVKKLWSMKLRVQDQEEDQRGPGERLYERTVKHVKWTKWMPLIVVNGGRW